MKQARQYSAAQLQLTRSEKAVQPYMVTKEQKALFTGIMSDNSKTYNLFQNELVPAITMNDLNGSRIIRALENDYWTSRAY
ncbi:hypothetical protein [Sporolactobacillus vineae]|uniref:hypothetical protein n=1 Tax=Sporolactobacillus vineae TaxID=444463 RepID=UPI000289C849|nr:hypothetical protein [Sporolactobacillus vineae]